MRERYELLAKLGEGGFGEVFKARQRSTGQLVAIKQLHQVAGGTGPERGRRLARFWREVQLCAQLSHPHVVRLIDSSPEQAETPYIVFEYIEGRTLFDLVSSDGPLKPKLAARLMGQVLEALSAAHAAGIVHRDLKPANVMVRSGARPHALVLDFGVGALADEQRLVDGGRLTRTGELIGTPAYAAPEQFGGEIPAPQTDLYSWGLVLLELLTGRRAVQGRNLADVLYQHLSGGSIRMPRDIADHPVGAVIRRATARDPEDRTDANTLLRLLEGCPMDSLTPVAEARVPAVQHVRTAPTIGMSEGDEHTAISPPHRVVPDDLPGITADRQGVLTAMSLSLELAKAGEPDADAQRLADTLRMLCNSAVQDWQGHLFGRLGHRAMVLFGYPTTAEGDARRAVGAGLELRDTVARMNAVTGDVALRLRVGIVCGEVLRWAAGPAAPPEPFRVVGPAIDRAPVLADAAAPGTVEVDPMLAAQLSGRFAIDSSDGRLVVRAPRAASIDDQAVGPLVGRDDELVRMARFQALAAAGEGQALVVCGSAGMGKSRLASEALGGGAHDWHVLTTACAVERRGSALRPVIQLLEGLMGIDGHRVAPTANHIRDLLEPLDLDPEEHGALLCALLSVPPPPGWVPPDLAPARLRVRVFESTADVFCALARVQPTALVIEDLHWADPSLVGFLEILLPALRSAPLLLLATARPEEAPSWSSLAFDLRLDLAPLSPVDCAALIEHLLPTEARSLAGRILARAEGVPLFVEAFAHAAQDSTLPPSLAELLATQLDAAGRARETAELAAAIGREVPTDLLAAVSALDPDDLRRDLDALIRHRILRPVPDARPPGFVFGHALMRDAAHDRMSTKRRAEAHRRIAETLEWRFERVVREQPGLLLYHYRHAGLTEPALRYAMIASKRALSRSEHHEGLTHARDGLAVFAKAEGIAEPARIEFDLQSVLASALTVTAGYGSPELETALDRAATLMDRVPVGRALSLRMQRYGFYLVRARHRDALDEARATLELSTSEARADMRTVAHVHLGGGVLLCMGRVAEGRTHLKLALEGFEPVQHLEDPVRFGQHYGVVLHSQLGVAAALAGDIVTAHTDCDRAVEFARGLDHSNTLCQALGNGARMFATLGDRRACWSMAVEHCSRSEKHGHRFWHVFGRILRAWAERAPLDVIRSALADYNDTGARHLRTLWLWLLAEEAVERGELAVAETVLAEALEFAERTAEEMCIAELARLRGALSAARGLDDAGQWFERAITEADGRGLALQALHARTDFGRWLEGRGDTAASALRDRVRADLARWRDLPETAARPLGPARGWVVIAPG